jgi:hypothetical protein
MIGPTTQGPGIIPLTQVTVEPQNPALLTSPFGRYDDFPEPYFREKRVLLPNTILKCVAFLGVKERGVFRPRATCFFVQYTEFQWRFDHLVTAEHVVSGLTAKGHDIWLRINLLNGETEEIQIDPGAFRYHPRNEEEPTDVAVVPFRMTYQDDSGKWHRRVDAENISINGPKSFMPTKEFSEDSIKAGGEVAIIGLFRSHYGQNRNTPVVRVGNIAALPGEPVHTKYAGYMRAYLVEARSIAGLSGSPVFSMRGSELNMVSALAQLQGKSGLGDPIALLGLMHGHFDVPNLNEDVVADQDEPERSVHTGIGVVIPAEKILETIQHPELIEMRKKKAKEFRESGGATADLLADEEAAPLATDANPNHRADFNSLLDAAVKKPVSKG